MTDLSMRLDGRVAVITGVSSGLGRGVAKVFAAEGARVIGAARRDDLGRELEAEVTAAGGELVFVPADIAKVDDCRRIVAEAVERYGRLDILVNNAGVQVVAHSHDITEEQWDQVLGTNLKGTFFCSRYALGPMRAQRRGVILNIASINAVTFPPRLAPYNAAKSGVVALTRTLAAEYAVDRIRVNTLIMGGVHSAMSDTTREEMGRLLVGPDYEHTSIPDGTFMSPESVGRFLAFLCTDDCRHLTGAYITLDQGLSAAAAGPSLADLVALAIEDEAIDQR